MANTPNARGARPTADQVDPPSPEKVDPPKVEEVPEAPAPSDDEIKVKTTGEFMLFDAFQGKYITQDGETVKQTQFILDKLESKELEKA